MHFHQINCQQAFTKHIADKDEYDILKQACRPSIAHIDSSLLEDKQKQELQDLLKHKDNISNADYYKVIDLMIERVPRHKNGRVARHGWLRLAEATNIALAMVSVEETVTPEQFRNRYEYLQRLNACVKERGRPKKITQDVGKAIRTFVNAKNAESGVTVKELALHFQLCERTMRDYIRDQHDLNHRVQSIKIKPRIEWARKVNIDHW